MKEILDYLITNFVSIVKQLNIEQLIEIFCAIFSSIGFIVIIFKLKREKNGNKETNRKSTEE